MHFSHTTLFRSEVIFEDQKGVLCVPSNIFFPEISIGQFKYSLQKLSLTFILWWLKHNMEDTGFEPPSFLLLPSSSTSRWGHASTMNLPGSTLYVNLYQHLQAYPCALCGAYKGFFSYYHPDFITVKKILCHTLMELAKSLFSLVIKQVAKALFSDACDHLAARNLPCTPRNMTTSSWQGSLARTCPISQCKSKATNLWSSWLQGSSDYCSRTKAYAQSGLFRMNPRALAWTANPFTKWDSDSSLHPIISFFHLPKSGEMMTVSFPTEAPGSLHSTHSYVS